MSISEEGHSERSRSSQTSDHYEEVDEEGTVREETDFVDEAPLKDNMVLQLSQSKKIAQSLRVLEPARKKLTTLEAQRVMGVLEAALRHIAIICALPSALVNLEDLSTLLTRGLVALAERYRDEKQRLDRVMAQRDATRAVRQDRIRELSDFKREQTLASDDFWGDSSSGASTEGGIEATLREYGVVDYQFTDDELAEFQSEKGQQRLNAEYREAYDQVRMAAQCLLIGCRSNPAAAHALADDGPSSSGSGGWRIKRGPGEAALSRFMRQLKDCMTLRLMSSPLDRDEQHSHLRQVHERDRAHRETVRELETELAAAQNRRDSNIREQNDVIRKLQADIHHVQKTAEDAKKKIRIDAERQIENDDKNIDSVCQKLKLEVAQKKSEFQARLTMNRTVESESRANKYKRDSALESLLQKYDEDMTRLQTEYESMEEEYIKEKKQLMEEEEMFKALEEEYLTIMEERRLLEEKQEAARREQEVLNKAIITIQSFWRSYKLRKGVRGKSGKRGGGGKKKGKK